MEQGVEITMSKYNMTPFGSIEFLRNQLLKTYGPPNE
jgi:hypothetical protein